MHRFPVLGDPVARPVTGCARSAAPQERSFWAHGGWHASCNVLRMTQLLRTQMLCLGLLFGPSSCVAVDGSNGFEAKAHDYQTLPCRTAWLQRMKQNRDHQCGIEIFARGGRAKLDQLCPNADSTYPVAPLFGSYSIEYGGEFIDMNAAHTELDNCLFKDSCEADDLRCAELHGDEHYRCIAGVCTRRETDGACDDSWGWNNADDDDCFSDQYCREGVCVDRTPWW